MKLGDVLSNYSHLGNLSVHYCRLKDLVSRWRDRAPSPTSMTHGFEVIESQIGAMERRPDQLRVSVIRRRSNGESQSDRP